MSRFISSASTGHLLYLMWLDAEGKAGGDGSLIVHFFIAAR
jgi:hypothetical protein